MSTIYHKLIAAESEINSFVVTEDMISNLILKHINKINELVWYTEFSPQEFFNIANERGQESYLHTGMLIYKLSILNPNFIQLIKWPTKVCILQSDGTVTVTQKDFEIPTYQSIQSGHPSYLSSVNKQSQLILADEINSSLPQPE